MKLLDRLRTARQSAHALVAALACTMLACGARPPVTSHAGCDGTQRGSGLPSCVVTTAGVKSIEEEYIPGVIECELGPLTKAEAALDAQAISARTYLLKHLLAKGPQAEVPTTPRFQCWKTPHRARAFAAARRTVGLVMEYEGEVINGNYVSGARRRNADCGPLAPKVNGYAYADWDTKRGLYRKARKARRRHPFKGTSWTEVVVTYNDSRRGDAVLPSPIASRRAANRGALSQWGAICLAEQREYGMEQILAYFYGEDIKLAQRAPAPPPTGSQPSPTQEAPKAEPAAIEGVLIERTRPIPASESSTTEDTKAPREDVDGKAPETKKEGPSEAEKEAREPAGADGT